MMQMTGVVKSRPSWRLSCHTYSYPECQLGRLVKNMKKIWETVRAPWHLMRAVRLGTERLGTLCTQLLPIF